MQVTIHTQSGFCFGVIRAIDKAERALAEGADLYSLGEIVHNRAEVSRLKGKGLRVISHSDLPQLADVTLLVRAHGEPPQTYLTAQRNGIRLIDATCPVVLRLQQQIRDTYHNRADANAQLLIFGQKGHAEVNGLVGQVGGDARVVESADDIDDWSRPVIIFAQTTKSEEEFHSICSAIRSRLPAHLSLEAHNTVCRHVSQRIKHLREFAAQHDVIVFVCGASSSNGNVLYDLCRSVNSRSYRIEGCEDLRSDWFGRCRRAGVCGATSTPQWLMASVAQRIEELCRHLPCNQSEEQ